MVQNVSSRTSRSCYLFAAPAFNDETPGRTRGAQRRRTPPAADPALPRAEVLAYCRSVNHRLISCTILLAAAMICLSAPAAAAQTGTAVLQGVARGPDAAPLDAVAVSIEGDALLAGAPACGTRRPHRRDAPGGRRGRHSRAHRTAARFWPRRGHLHPADGADPEATPIEPRAGFGAIALAPAVDATDFSAYGEAGAGMNAYRIEGLDAGDPEGRSLGPAAAPPRRLDRRGRSRWSLASRNDSGGG